MSTTRELEDYTRFLRNAAPEEYRNFCAAFANYTKISTDILINATGDVALAQGRAQQCVKILRVLEDIRDG